MRVKLRVDDMSTTTGGRIVRDPKTGLLMENAPGEPKYEMVAMGRVVLRRVIDARPAAAGDTKKRRKPAAKHEASYDALPNAQLLVNLVALEDMKLFAPGKLFWCDLTPVEADADQAEVAAA